MDLEKLRKQLEIDEGVVHEIYLHHLGYPTFGIGHLVTESDPEHGLAVGTAISSERCSQAFESDIKGSLARLQHPLLRLSQFARRSSTIIANMMFNLIDPDFKICWHETWG